MKVGIIGVGTIATAFVKGLVAQYGRGVEVFLSPRNLSNAEALRSEFDNVKIAGSNQEVADSCEWVVLSVLPKNAEQIIRSVKFNSNHKVVSFISDSSISKVVNWTGSVSILVRMVPLPFIEYRTGPLLIYPASCEVEGVFGGLGEIVLAADESDLELMLVITSLMSSFYAVLSEVISWGRNSGLSAELSKRYTVSFFEALLFKAKNIKSEELEQLWKEMTPGGLNESAINRISSVQGIRAWPDALDGVLKRIKQEG